MKCPKCDYLGFDTGDRCKNCGYDFSLSPPVQVPSTFDADLILRQPYDTSAHPTWDDAFGGDRRVESAHAASGRHRPNERFPLFSPDQDGGDEPLIKLPVAPRAPLAVRRTPEIPKLRAVPKRIRSVEGEPVFQFTEIASPAPEPVVESVAEIRARTSARLAAQVSQPDLSGAGPRVVAVAIDQLVLSGIDLVVIYLTVRMAGLPMSGWTQLPLVPLGIFLVLLKLSYFCVFTVVGGQTIGKMGMRLRVVTVQNGPLGPTTAAARAVAATLSAALLGLGYLPALIGGDRRALHDRLTGTRVVAVPPA